MENIWDKLNQQWDQLIALYGLNAILVSLFLLPWALLLLYFSIRGIIWAIRYIIGAVIAFLETLRTALLGVGKGISHASNSSSVAASNVANSVKTKGISAGSFLNENRKIIIWGGGSIAIIITATYFIFLFVRKYHSEIIRSVIFLALGFLIFKVYKSVQAEKEREREKFEKMKQDAFLEGEKLGIAHAVSEQVFFEPLREIITNKYGLTLENDRRKILGADGYGRVTDEQKIAWHLHVYEVVDTCVLDEKEESLRDLYKQLISLKLGSKHSTILDFVDSRDDAINYFEERVKGYSDFAELTFFHGEAYYFEQIDSSFSKYFAKISKAEFDINMNGLDYEHYCADLMRKLDWNATVLPASGDHGADIIAKKQNKTIAIQCKKYSKPLGNTPVQEISTAQIHYKTEYAAVVSNQTYTKGAQTLAKSANVLLLHHDDLSRLDEILKTM